MEGRSRKWHDDPEMKGPLLERRLEPFAVEYIQDRLREGNTLASEVLATVDFSCGHVSTCLPENVTLNSLADLRTGGKLPVPSSDLWRGTDRNGELLLMIPIPNSDDWLIDQIKSFLTAKRSSVCIFEDSLKRPSDPVLRNISTRYATHGNEVYHVLLNQDADRATIQSVVRAARSIPTFVGVFAEEEINPADISRLSDVKIRRLAERATGVVVGAFDGEGYLVWSRDVQPIKAGRTT